LQGLTESAIRSSLQGTAAFQFLDGAYQGVNLAEVIQEAAGLLGLNLGRPNGTSEKRTDFAMLKGSLQIEEGVIRNRDLQLQSPLLRITGEGKVDLSADHVDYMLTTKLVKSLSGQGGRTASQLKGIPIPVRISGPLTDLNYKPDLSGLVKARLQQKLKKEKAKLINDAQNKVKQKAAELLGKPDGLNDAIQGLKGLLSR
jgi:AsmA protein